MDDADDLIGLEVAEIAQFGNRSTELFDSCLVLASNTKQGKTFYYVISRGNALATKTLVNMFAGGKLGDGPADAVGVVID